jgi:hypothetical protein
MNAREKLNVAYVNGALVVAGVLAMLAQSWTVFWLSLAGLVFIQLGSGGIRPSKRN